MYKTIYVPVDKSDHSNQAVDVGVHLAKLFGSKIVGSHVYAAKMHDKRFKQMEAGLPEEYHDEKELDRQRQIHEDQVGEEIERLIECLSPRGRLRDTEAGEREKLREHLAVVVGVIDDEHER